MTKEEALLAAARDGDFNEVGRLVNSKEVDINTLDIDGNTALHLSVENGHFNITTFLLRKGSAVNKQNHSGETPLLLAARSGDSRSVTVLLKHGADKRIEDSNGRTPFFVAMSAQHPEVASQLLPGNNSTSTGSSGNMFGRTSTGVNQTSEVLEEKRVESAKKKDEQHLRDAAEAGDIVGVKEILRLSPEIDLDSTDDHGHTALYRAAFYGRTQVVEFLLKEGADPDFDDMDGQTPLHVAAEKGFGRIMKALLQKTENMNVQNLGGSTPMFLAAQNGNIAVLRELVESKADPNIPNNNEETPLWAATASGQEAFVKVLLEYSKEKELEVEVDSHNALTGLTPLHLAAGRGDVRIARLLLDCGASKEVRDVTGSTALFIAADKGRTKMVSLLLDHKVAVDAVNDHGETPLYVSSLNGHVPVTRELLQRGADTEAADNNGQTPLMGAAQEGHTAIISQLLQAGAEIEAANNVGESPLMIASLEGFQNAVAVLVDNGADIATARNDGKTALHLASMDGHIGVLNVLLSAVIDQDKNSKNAKGQRTSPLHLATDTQGETALHVAARFRQVSAMSLLLDYDEYFQKQQTRSSIYGKLAAVQNKFGWTALHSAVDRAHRGAIDLLLSNGANVNAADIFGNTPIHLASRGVDYVILHELLAVQDSNTGSLNVDGRTPLHFAAACVRPSSVTFLLNRGVDVLSADVYKKYPKDVLAQSEVCNPEIALSKGLCNIEKQRPDMCPLPLGNKTELVETKILLQVAENERNQTKPCFNPCSGRMDEVSSNNAFSESAGNLSQAVASSQEERVSFPILGALIPVIILVLLIMLAVYLCQKRRAANKAEAESKRLNDMVSQWTEQKIEQEVDVTRLGSPSHGNESILPAQKGPFDTVKRLLAQAPSVTDSGSGSDSDSSCGWSDISDMETPTKTIPLTGCSTVSRSLSHWDLPTIKVPLPDDLQDFTEKETMEDSQSNEMSLKNLKVGLPLYRMGSVPRTKPREPPIQSKTSFSIRITDDCVTGHEPGSFTFPNPAPDRSRSTPMF